MPKSSNFHQEQTSEEICGSCSDFVYLFNLAWVWVSAVVCPVFLLLYIRGHYLCPKSAFPKLITPRGLKQNNRTVMSDIRLGLMSCNRLETALNEAGLLTDILLSTVQ